MLNTFAGFDFFLSPEKSSCYELFGKILFLSLLAYIFLLATFLSSFAVVEEAERLISIAIVWFSLDILEVK